MTRDTFLGAFTILVGVAGALLTAQVPSSTFTDDPGPHLFPYFACAMLVLCGCGIVATGFRRAGVASQAEGFMSPGDWARSAILMGVFALYGIALWLVGFHLATPIMTFVFYAAIAGRQKVSLWRGALYALLTYGALYLLFVWFLRSYLPEGLLF